MPSLVLIRHGQSLWNAENRFTGWEDIDLSPQGEKEVIEAGNKIKAMNISFDVAFTSCLKRAIRTLYFILEQTSQLWIPIRQSWRLNERHYGLLQGLNKQETIEKYGADQVFEWRRSFETPPPFTSSDKAPSYSRIYPDVSKALPKGESLKMTMERVLPLWETEIEKKLKEGQNILIAAHGNSLRSLLKHIQKIDDKSISKIEIPTATPILIEWTSIKDIPYQPKKVTFFKRNTV